MTSELPCTDKLLPSRVEEPYRFKVCKCGHYWHNHDLGILGLYKTKCEKCMCDKYRQLGKFTSEQISKLKPCEDEE